MQLVQPLVALELFDFVSNPDVLGFGSLEGHQVLTNNSLVTYTTDTNITTVGIESSILFSGEVVARAADAQSKYYCYRIRADNVTFH